MSSILWLNIYVVAVFRHIVVEWVYVNAFLFVCKISLCRHEVQTDVIHLMDEYLCCCSVSAHCG